MPDVFRRLVELFTRFPGIGPRQARRFVYHLLSLSESELQELAELTQSLKKQVALCPSCFRFHSGKATSVCSICKDAHRDASKLMLVEKDADLEQIERAGAYEGLYFVLGGKIPILDEYPERRIRIAELERALEKKEGLSEIIFALSATPEGEHTELYLRQKLTADIEKHAIRISVLARGLSTGAELEYADTETVRSALKNRA